MARGTRLDHEKYSGITVNYIVLLLDLCKDNTFKFVLNYGKKSDALKTRHLSFLRRFAAVSTNFQKPIRFCSNLVETFFNPFPMRISKKNWGHHVGFQHGADQIPLMTCSFSLFFFLPALLVEIQSTCECAQTSGQNTSIVREMILRVFLALAIVLQVNIANTIFGCLVHNGHTWANLGQMYLNDFCCAHGKVDTETNLVVTVGFTTKGDHQTTSKISFFRSCLMIDLGRETDGKNGICLDVLFAFGIIKSYTTRSSWALFLGRWSPLFFIP